MLPGVSPAMVFLHGFALDARMWREQVRAFADSHRVLTVDLPGFGPQARDAGEVAPAREVARAMDVAGLASAHLVAHSYGAAVAVDLALLSPRRVASLTLLSPLLLGRKTRIEAWPRCVAVASEGDRATATELWLEDPLFDSVRGDDLLFDDVRQVVLDYQGGHWTGKVTTRWFEPEPERRLPEVSAPTLLMTGESDLPAFRDMADDFAKSMPRVRRHVVTGAGHFLNWEAPELVNALLSEFLRAGG